MPRSVGLLERDADVRQLRDALVAAKGGHGSIVVIGGAAGIGKTSVLAAAGEIAREMRFRVLCAQARQLEQELSWGATRQLFEPVTQEIAAGRYELQAAAELAGPALGLPASRSVDTSGMLHGLYWLASDLAGAGPLALSVDDVQWADRPSQQLVAYLAARVADLPLVLLITVRRGIEAPIVAAIENEAGTRRLELRQLSAAASATLVGSVLGSEAEPAFCAACHACTGGNPFFLRELLNRVSVDAISPTAENAGAVASITPETVAHSVLLRLSQVGPPARALAAAVAILGGGCTIVEAAELAGLSGDEAALAADQLAGADILLARVPLEFIHPIVRAAVYEDLPPFERAAQHRHAAEVVHGQGAPAERVAAHLLLCDPGGEEWVRARLREAAVNAVARAAPDAAHAFLSRAVAEFPGSADASLLLALSRAAAMAQLPEAVERLEAAYAASVSTAQRVEIVLELAPTLLQRGRLTDAVALCEAQLRELGPDDRDQRLLLIATLVAAVGVDYRLIPIAEPWAAQFDPGLRGETRAERLALVSQVAWLNTSASPVAPMAELASRALAGGALLRELTSDSLFVTFCICALMFAERVDEAMHHFDAALADARARGSSLGFSLTSVYRSTMLWRFGTLPEAIADARQALATGALALSSPLIATHATVFLAEALIGVGQLDEAERVLQVPESGEVEPFRRGFVRATRGRLLLARGQAELAAAQLLEGGALMGPTNAAVWPWRASAAIALHAVGKRREALGLADEELGLVRANGSRWAMSLILRARGLVIGGEDGIRSLEQAVSCAAGCGARLEQARSLCDLGAAHRRAGRRRAATEVLQAAYELAQECGAAPIAAAAREELRVAGARPQRERRLGRDALTPSELRVAELAADGLSNREIAQALFVSLRTVETHLTHVYQKLEIGSREKLAGAL